MLDYRTVSTQHATVTFKKGNFFFRDLSSSNGSMLNIRRPLKLPYNQWVRLRFGRSIVALKAKRSWIKRKFTSSSRQSTLELSQSGASQQDGSSGTPSGGVDGQLKLLESLCQISPLIGSHSEGSRAFNLESFESLSPSVAQARRVLRPQDTVPVIQEVEEEEAAAAAAVAGGIQPGQGRKARPTILAAPVSG